MFIYITLDNKSFVSDYKYVQTDGYIKVFLLDTWIRQFAQYPDKFYYDSTENKLKNPGNLPDISLDDVNASLQNLQTSVSASQTELQKAIQSDSQGTQALTALAQNQSMLATQVQQALASVTALAQDNSQASKASNDKTSSNASSTPTTSVTK